MKMAVVGANGRAGKLIVEEAVRRGIEVTAIVREENKTAAAKSLAKDATALEAGDLAGFDVVVDAVGGWTAETIGGITSSMKHLADILEGTQTRLLVVGGAGSLFVNKERTLTVADARDFPADWKPLAAAHSVGLAYLRTSSNLKWTYISPACDFRADAPRTGEYILGGEDMVLNDKGESIISYADYAVAMVDEATSAAPHIAQRISVIGK